MHRIPYDPVHSTLLYITLVIRGTLYSVNMTQVCRPGAGDSAQLHAVGCHTALVARLEVNNVPSILSAVKRPIGFTIGFHNHGEGPY